MRLRLQAIVAAEQLFLVDGLHDAQERLKLLFALDGLSAQRPHTAEGVEALVVADKPFLVCDLASGVCYVVMDLEGILGSHGREETLPFVCCDEQEQTASALTFSCLFAHLKMRGAGADRYVPSTTVDLVCLLLEQHAVGRGVVKAKEADKIVDHLVQEHGLIVALGAVIIGADVDGEGALGLGEPIFP